ncbi:hypothetical protein [Pseudomonas sp. St316]|uniref:hypothetical protein n=1 Tax=Pseudomonas sp. St316 TaxID=2678257 RepID=UPI001BB447B5|nr:hypothetical protein [Pseudomonas sp. St316]
MTVQRYRNLLETFCFKFPGFNQIDGKWCDADAQDCAMGRQESTNETGVVALNL